MKEREKPKQTWPGVEAAQSFVLPSYQWMIARIEAVDSRIQTLVTFVATVTLAIPAIAKSVNTKPVFTSGWFIAALATAVVSVVVGLVVRSAGSLTLPSPRIHYERYLHKKPWQFWKDALYFAGEHFEANSALVKRKADGLTAMTVLFVIELGLLTCWIAIA